MDLKDKIIELAATHPVPSDHKLERRVNRLERMRTFYDSKIPEAPEKQGSLFKEFVTALYYAMTSIKMYRKLTKAINELAEEATNERTNTQDNINNSN